MGITVHLLCADPWALHFHPLFVPNAQPACEGGSHPYLINEEAKVQRY